MSGTFKMEWNAGWETEAMKGTGVREITEKTTAEVAANAIDEAPRRSPTKGNWNQLKKNVHARVAMDEQGWWGNVITEEESHVRHAIRQELGWHDKKKKWHEGRYWLKAALERARVE